MTVFDAKSPSSDQLYIYADEGFPILLMDEYSVVLGGLEMLTYVGDNRDTVAKIYSMLNEVVTDEVVNLIKGKRKNLSDISKQKIINHSFIPTCTIFIKAYCTATHTSPDLITQFQEAARELLREKSTEA